MVKISKIKKRLDKDKIIVLIDSWDSFASRFYLLRESIPKEYGYIQYVYPDEILCPSPKETKENFLHLIKTIVRDLNGLKKKKPRLFYLYGQSLGGLFCMIISDIIKVKKVMLIVPGYNLADAFWQGESTQELKNDMIQKYKTTLLELEKYWKEISPDNYFKNKSRQTEFSIILSKNDKVIPTSNGRRLLKLLKDKNFKVHNSWTTHSHAVECIKEGIFLEDFKKWISSKQ
jgi:hypothetical protein